MKRKPTDILRLTLCAGLLAGAVVIGCSSKPEPFPSQRRRVALASAGDESVAPATQRSDLLAFNRFSVYVSPPLGWKMKINSSDERAEHVVWNSPGGNTAFGVIYFKLPFPVGHDLAFEWGFLPEARKREGSAEVLEKYWDPSIEGLRFTVKTPRYTVEAKFFVRGSRGWAAYSGTKTTQPVNQDELRQARQAREDADFGEELDPAEETPKSAADERG